MILKNTAEGQTHTRAISSPHLPVTGVWVDNKLNGQGTLTYADGTVKTGQWENDSYMG